MSHTHAATLNGTVSGEVTNPHRSELAELRWMVDSLDGVRRYAWTLWRLPQGTPIDLLDTRVYPTQYLQLAGTRQRMTIEIRRDGSDGMEPGHYVVGRERGGTGPADEAGEVIRWDKHSTVVRPSEVFTSDQALPVLVAYYQTDDVPPGHSLRAVHL